MKLHCFTNLKFNVLLILTLFSTQLSFSQVNTCIEDFNNHSPIGPVSQAGNWHSVLSDLYFQTDPITLSPVLRASDASGGSYFSNITDYDLDWYAKFGGCQFCFDIRYDGGPNNPGLGFFPITIFQNGPAGNLNPNLAAISASFKVNVGIGNSWVRVCLPIEKSSGGNLPSNALGTWVGPTAAQWDNLIQNVDGVYIPVDFAGGSNPVENIYVDNFCFDKCPAPSLSCDNHINVSLDSNCCAIITPAMVVEGNYPLNCLKVVLKDKFGNIIPSSPRICGPYIGQTITYELVDTCTKNRCWGTLIVEDKLGPKIECENPDTVFCNNSGYNWTPPKVLDNCGGIVKTIIIADETTKYPCDSFCIARRKITYTYQDQYGNRSDTCMKIICYKKINFSDIVWPLDTMFSCEDWDTIPPPSISGVPMAGGYPLYPDWFLCKMAVSYEDQLIPICPKTFKVLRTWTVLDWCKRSPDNVYKHYQIVKVLDEKGPKLERVPDITVSTDVWSCTGTVIIPPPQISWECSDSVSILVEYKINGKNGVLTFDGTNKNNVKRLPNGYYSVTGLALGLNLVIFHVTDQCGNTSESFTEVTVRDFVPPIAVCDQKTTVSLTIDGTAKIEALTFDDGSHDNCGLDYFEVKRMDNGYPCDSVRGIEWGPYVYFCCEDIGKTIMVSMRVWDKAGNSNTCMVEVEVQDKIAPVIFCPPHITISCEYDYPDLSVFGTVVTDINNQKAIVIKDPKVKFSGTAIDGYAYDGCGVTVIELPPVYALPCGKGTITRTWEATDPRGLKSRCSQIITVFDYNPDNVTVVWPRDTFSNSICTTKPDFNADNLGRPKVYGADKCNTMMINYVDQVFTLEPDACVKVLRKWTVIDWCIYQPNNPQTKGYWSWVQVIKVNNIIAPTFTTSCKDRTVAVFGPGCGGQVELKAKATDDCTDSIDLVWYHEVDLYNDGKSPGIEYLHSGPGADASNYYPIGTHKITFRVKDACGNESWCIFLINVIDGKLPTPYCIGNIVTTVMPSTKSIDIWAKDFNLNSEDNCTPKDSLKYYFLVNNILVPSLTLDCSNIGKNTLRVYVKDQAGNTDYCEVILDLQDPNKVCGNTNLSVGGKITTTDYRNMQDVTMVLERSNPIGTNQAYTDNQGAYSFVNLNKGSDFQIKASYNQNHINGVSTQDIIMIQKHILGIQLFDSPHKYIAADANNNGTITVADIAEIRKLVLGITDKFAKNESWRFVPQSYAFVEPNNPWPFEEKIKYQELLSSKNNNDFYAIKIGDVSGNASASGVQGTSSRSKEQYTMYLQEQDFVANQQIKVPVYASQDMHVSGMQMAFETDKSMELSDIANGKINISKEHFSSSNQSIKLSYTTLEDIEIKEGDVLFYLIGKATLNGSIQSAIHLNQTTIQAEIYDANVQAKELRIERRKVGVTTNEISFELYQNVPNPFVDQTIISYEIPLTGEVKIQLSDITGKNIYKTNVQAFKGKNNFILDNKVKMLPGVYYLKLGYENKYKSLMLLKY
ncbi:MAG: HYR domain-containing protein [Saprospiraceae bacterium]|nr:HYR domain-containing protein [Saprospiraceae bacterium]